MYTYMNIPNFQDENDFLVHFVETGENEKKEIPLGWGVLWLDCRWEISHNLAPTRQIAKTKADPRSSCLPLQLHLEAPSPTEPVAGCKSGRTVKTRVKSRANFEKSVLPLLHNRQPPGGEKKSCGVDLFHLKMVC